MDERVFLAALGGFLGTLLAALSTFLVVLLREARKTQAAADKRLERQSSENKAQLTAVLASAERGQNVLVDVIRDHLAEAVGAISDARRRLSDVHDAVLSSPCRANGAGPGHVREG